MSERNNRYKLMVRYIGYALLAAFLAFLTMLIASGYGITWLKVLSAIVAILVCLLCLGYLYLTQELLRPRSLWRSACFAAIAVCTVFSLLLAFPSPNPLKQPNPYATVETTDTTGATETLDDPWYDAHVPGDEIIPGCQPAEGDITPA